MKGRRKTKEACCDCGLSKENCICSHIQDLDLSTRVSLVIHYKEMRRTTNTGLLAVKSLKNSEVIVRGKERSPLDLSLFLNLNKYAPVLLYPSEGAQELTPEWLKTLDRPLQVLVPDGNWRQASKVHYRHKELKDLPRVFVNKPHKRFDILRKESKKKGLPTMAAIALALGVIEGVGVEQRLLSIFQKKLDSTLRARGG